MKFPFGAFRPIFRGELAVSFREGIQLISYDQAGHNIEAKIR